MQTVEVAGHQVEIPDDWTLRFQAEQQIISAAMSADGEVRAWVRGNLPGISWRRFNDGRHRVMWRAIESVWLPALDITDPFSEEIRRDRLVEELAKAGALALAGGKKYVTALCGLRVLPAYGVNLARKWGLVGE